jgi:predicted PurR-regulated permease PerM
MENKHVTISIGAETIIKAILIVALMLGLIYVRDILLIFLTAVVLASAIEPGTKLLIKHGIPRIISVVLIYLVLIIIVAAFFYIIIPQFLRDLSSFMSILPKYVTTLDVTLPDASTHYTGWQSAILGLSQSQSLGEVARNLTQTLSTGSVGLLASLNSIFGGVISFVLIIVLSFYLAVQDSGIEDFLRLVTPLKQEKYVINVWRRTQYKIGKWMQGQLLLALIVGVLVFVGLSLLHVPNPFFFALISAAFEIIPVFGPIIGAIPGVMVAFLHGGVGLGLVVAIMYIVIQQIESHVIYPLVVKKLVNVQPLLVIIALVVGAKLGGFLGILLSVPLASALTELMYDYSKNRLAARERMVIIEK